MAGANWGIGIGAFADGLSRGMAMRGQIDEARERKQIKNLTKEGVAQAERAQQDAVNSSISTVGEQAPAAPVAPAAPAQEGIAAADPAAQAAAAPAAPAVAGIEGPPKPKGWKVGDKEYGSIEEARKAAQNDVGPVMDFFMRDAAPKIRDAYIAQGKIDQAERFSSWIEESSTKAGLKAWAGAVRAAQFGDFESAAKNLVKAYNAKGYYDDGYEAGHAEVMKDKDGNVTGFRLKIKGADGKEFSREFSGSEDMISAGLGLLSPQQAFDRLDKELLSTKEAKLKFTEKQADRAERMADEKELVNYKAGIQANQIEQREQNLRTRPEKPGKQSPISQAQLLAVAEREHARLLELDRQYRKMTPEQQRAKLESSLQKRYPLYFRANAPAEGGPAGAAPAGGGVATGANGVPVLQLD